jgi:hypothetical protein
MAVLVEPCEHLPVSQPVDGDELSLPARPVQARYGGTDQFIREWQVEQLGRRVAALQKEFDRSTRRAT